MIIGISGYIGSGKDTVGQIIQKITTPRASRHELDEFDRPRRDNNGNYILEPEKSPWEIKKFAGKLKQIASMLTGIPVEKFEDQEFKNTLLGQEWWTSLDIGGGIAQGIPITVREFLQKLGTEAIRDGLHKNAWVNALMADYNLNSKWIITDARFENEAKAIKDKHGYLIRINRFQKKHTSVGLHPSETGLDNWTFDFTIDNNGTLQELEDKVRQVLKHIVVQTKIRVVKAQQFTLACELRDLEKSLE